MHYPSLGNSGLHVSVMGLGTNSFGGRADRETSIRIIHRALDLGITFLDTANIYTGTLSEQIIGEALADRRHQAVIATKAGFPMGDGPNDKGASRLHLRRELEASLRRLRTDYVDLYQIHSFDPKTPLEETLLTLDGMVREGKVRYIGASNYAAWELMKALALSDRMHLTRYISVQPCYSLADRTVEQELVPLCLDQGVGIIPYFPLAGGILSGKYTSGQMPAGSRMEKEPRFARYLNEERLDLGRQVSALAAATGTTPAALSLAWLVQKPAVATVIVGATSEQQLDQNVEATRISIDPDTFAQLEEVSISFRYKHPFAVYRLPS